MTYEERDNNVGGQPPQYSNGQPQQPYQQPSVPPAQNVRFTLEKTGNGLGVAALVLGIIAIIGSWIPFLNIVSLLFAIIAICLGIAGLIVGVIKKRSKGTAIAGITLGIISFILFTVSNIAAVSVIDEASLPTDNTSAENEQPTDSRTADAEEPLEESVNTALGTPVTTAKFEITVNGSTSSTQIDNGEYLYYEPDAGNIYAVINVSLKNISNEMETFNTTDFQLLTLDESVKYSPTSMIVTSGEETFFWFDSLNPGTSKTGNVVFELPQGLDVSTLKLRYNDTWSFDSNYCYFEIQ